MLPPGSAVTGSRDEGAQRDPSSEIPPGLTRPQAACHSSGLLESPWGRFSDVLMLELLPSLSELASLGWDLGIDIFKYPDVTLIAAKAETYWKAVHTFYSVCVFIKCSILLIIFPDTEYLQELCRDFFYTLHSDSPNVTILSYSLYSFLSHRQDVLYSKTPACPSRTGTYLRTAVQIRKSTRCNTVF